MRVSFILWKTFFRDEISQSFRNSKPKSSTQNKMNWNKQIILAFEQLSYCASCRRYSQHWTTSFPHNWFMMIVCLQKDCKLHSSCHLLSANLLLGDNEHPCFPPKTMATRNTQILGPVLKTNSGFSCRAVEVYPSTQLWT